MPHTNIHIQKVKQIAKLNIVMQSTAVTTTTLHICIHVTVFTTNKRQQAANKQSNDRPARVRSHTPAPGFGVAQRAQLPLLLPLTCNKATAAAVATTTQCE